MSLIQWEPLSEFDRLFDQRFFPLIPKLGWDLAVDIYQADDTVVAKMSLPGVLPSNIHVSVEDDVLSVTGRREEEVAADQKDYHSKEIRRGSFSRTIALPKVVDTKHAKAEYQDGILTVLMPVVASLKNTAATIPVSTKGSPAA